MGPGSQGAMDICVHVDHIYIYTCVHMFAVTLYVYMYIYIYTHCIYIYIHMYAFFFFLFYVSVRHTYIHICICRHIHIHIHIHLHIHVHIQRKCAEVLAKASLPGQRVLQPLAERHPAGVRELPALLGSQSRGCLGTVGAFMTVTNIMVPYSS